MNRSQLVHAKGGGTTDAILCLPSVIPMLIVGGEAWTVLDRHLRPLSAFQLSCCQRLCGVARTACVPDDEILSN